MLFSEIYSAYYNTVASIITAAQGGTLDSHSLYEIVRKSAFPESVISIGTALESGKWTLVKKDFTTNIQNIPTMPLSLLQKQWLKAICGDKRIRLFVEENILLQLEDQLGAVEPLFTEKDFCLYDKYSDGDQYEESSYAEKFKTILNAIHKKKMLKLVYEGRFDSRKRFKCTPYKIEYSQKDDKFRLLAKIRNRLFTLNIARIIECQMTETQAQTEECDSLRKNSETLTLEIYDDRKALERVMLAFAHFEKSAVQVKDFVYRLTLKYDPADETELVVRVLSFGQMVKVIEPAGFRELIKERIARQIKISRAQ